MKKGTPANRKHPFDTFPVKELIRLEDKIYKGDFDLPSINQLIIVYTVVLA